MLQNGEADIAEIGTSNIPTVERFGMVRNGSGTARMVTVMFAGNLWETNHPTTGDALEIVTYTHDLPWLGNPHKPDDGNNPAGIDDTEQARLVRQALALSIDRELINEAVIGGVGWPVEIPYFDINNPSWDDERWGVGYDPAMAEALLDQAGYPRNANGERFKIAMFAWPCRSLLWRHRRCRCTVLGRGWSRRRRAPLRVHRVPPDPCWTLRDAGVDRHRTVGELCDDTVGLPTRHSDERHRARRQEPRYRDTGGDGQLQERVCRA